MVKRGRFTPQFKAQGRVGRVGAAEEASGEALAVS